MRWIDTFGLCEGHHLRIPLKAVDLIVWDSLRIGMGKRSRRRGDYLVVFQKVPIRVGSTWKDHGIPSRWPEKVDRSIHPHLKPINLITRLIAATTEVGDTVIDPAAGSFVVARAARAVARNFVGGDLVRADLSWWGKSNEAWLQLAHELRAGEGTTSVTLQRIESPAGLLHEPRAT
jgi:hypothetical protein